MSSSSQCEQDVVNILPAAMQDPTFPTAPWRKFYHHAWWDGLWVLLADANWMQWTLWRLQCKTLLFSLRRDELFIIMPGDMGYDFYKPMRTEWSELFEGCNARPYLSHCAMTKVLWSCRVSAQKTTVQQPSPLPPSRFLTNLCVDLRCYLTAARSNIPQE